MKIIEKDNSLFLSKGDGWHLIKFATIDEVDDVIRALNNIREKMIFKKYDEKRKSKH